MKIKFLTLLFLVFTVSFTVNASFPVKAKKQAIETTVVSNEVERNSGVRVEATQEVSVPESSELESPASGGGKSQLVALLICILVGGIGIHRFYLGYTTIGIIQLLTLGGCGIWALIDLVRIATGDLKPKGGKYTETL